MWNLQISESLWQASSSDGSYFINKQAVENRIFLVMHPVAFTKILLQGMKPKNRICVSIDLSQGVYLHLLVWNMTDMKKEISHNQYGSKIILMAFWERLAPAFI